ncbi:MAG: putative 2-aminoethylphosphonate ABC transporter substrate-binding protein [Holophagaceae bacterium]|nr:putative 2-aminoethylphosphonate ABC transporter substrate-binding protein [Holophagaceae bacterium]
MIKVINLAIFLVAIISLVFGCRQKSVAAKSGIVVYTALENEQVDKYLKPFKKEYPKIDVKIVRDSTGVITARLVAEGTSTPADLIWGTAASSLLILKQKEMLEPYSPVGVEEVLPHLKDSATSPHWVGIAAWESAIVVNTEEAKKKNLPQIRSFQDLLQPEFRGQIIMSNPSSSNAGFLTVSGLIQLLGEERAFEYLDKLHENVAMYLHSGSAPAKKVGAGEFAIGISYGYAAVSQKKKGYPIEVIFPAEGSGWDVEANALIKKEAIKDEARQFLDWAISKRAMDDLKEDYAVTSIKTGSLVPLGYAQDPFSQLIPNNDLRWAAENRDRILQKWIGKYDGKSEAKQ